MAYELDMAEADENGDPERARRRHALGFADLMWVQGISTLLLLSGRARKALGEQLAASGQLLDAVLNGDVVHFFHCTTLIAATAEGSRVHYLPGGKPSGAPELVLEPAAIPSTGFFRTNWPAPPPGLPEVDYTTFPPPTALFATQAVVERVADSGLTGFRFDNTRLSGLGS